MRAQLLVVVGLLVACDKGQPAKPKRAPAPGPAPAPAPTPAPPGPQDQQLATLSAGALELGCFAWSEEMKAAACIVGERQVPEQWDASLTFVGTLAQSENLAPVVVSPPIEPGVAQSVSAILASHHFVKLLPAVSMEHEPITFYPGVTVRWTRTETAPASEVSPPAHDNTIVLECGAEKRELMTDSSPGDNPTATYRKLGDFTLIELVVPRALEGEYGMRVYAAMLDADACK